MSMQLAIASKQQIISMLSEPVQADDGSGSPWRGISFLQEAVRWQ